MNPVLRRSCLAAMAVVLCAALAACRGESPATDTTLAADLPPEEVVTALVDALADGRFEDTIPLTVGGQAALLTLAEGASASDVAELVDAGADDVTANFWSGFAQTVDPNGDDSDRAVTAEDPVTQGGVEFVRVALTTGSAGTQYFAVRRGDDGNRVDLMATFGPVLADRLVAPVEALLSSANADAARILTLLSDEAPALQFSATRPDLPPDAHQSLLALIERVTRTG